MGWLLRVQKQTVSQLETFSLLLHCLSQMGSFSLLLEILNGTTWIIACVSSCESVAGKQKCHLPFTPSSLKNKISQTHCQIYEKQTAEPADLITLQFWALVQLEEEKELLVLRIFKKCVPINSFLQIGCQEPREQEFSDFAKALHNVQVAWRWPKAHPGDHCRKHNHRSTN